MFSISRFWFLRILFLTMMMPLCADSELNSYNIIPAPKEAHFSSAQVELNTVSIDADFALGHEADLLGEILNDEGISLSRDGLPIKLILNEVECSAGDSKYEMELCNQAYSLEIENDSITISGRTSQAIFYGLQTFSQLVKMNSIPVGSITDWPDLPVRMIMIDSARQNENMEYYRRVVDFAARYKMNAVLWHLTDDQTSTLYLEDYPELLHEHAWRPEQIRELVEYAADRYVELIPEIESLGHSRMFTRMPDFEDYLHMTDENQPDESWMGTSIPGFTNVLCPASEKAISYLEKSYASTSESFQHPWLHIGFDEVDMTTCARCIDAFGELNHDEWLAKSLQLASDLAANEGKKTALWGDMLLSHPSVADTLSPDNTIIFDWHYNADVKDDSVKFFKEKGFEIIASPALTCAPHMIMPDEHNIQNIANFTTIAREHDLLGINTTIWVPTRYMSDTLWTGIAWAAAHAWGGSNFEEAQFYEGFFEDYFGSNKGEAFQQLYNDLTAIIWHRTEFNTGAWMDEDSLEDARRLVAKDKDRIIEQIQKLTVIRKEMLEIRSSVSKHNPEWRTLEQSVEIMQYTMEHLLASEKDLKDAAFVMALDDRCLRYLKWIESDWDRNRFEDDPGKDGRFLQIQHLYYRFKQMHEFHQELLTSFSD